MRVCPMSKRFTDTNKWNKSFFSDLDIKAKLVWIYLLDNCDNTGVYPINMKLMSFQVGFKVDMDMLFSWFGSKIIAIESDKLFIKSFIDFQYGELNESNNAHKPVINLIKRIGPIEDLKCSYLGVQDKDKDKDQAKDKIKIKENKNFKNEIEEIYSTQYPLKVGKTKGVEKLLLDVRSEQDLENLKLAVDRYKKTIKDPKYIKHFSTFATTWREWLDTDAGSSDLGKPQSHDVSHIWNETEKVPL